MGLGQNRKLGNLGNFHFSSKSYRNLLVFVSVHFLWFLNLELQPVSKFEIKNVLRDFRVFDFNSETSEMLIFYS